MHRPTPILPLLLPALAVTGCGRGTDAPAEAAVSRPLFVDVTGAAGITYVHEKPRLDPQLDNIETWVSSVGAAAAAGDFDRDGRVDLYVTSSRKGRPNRRYRNLGDGTFTELAETLGVDDPGWTLAVGAADLSNDGRPDLYCANDFGPDQVFLNDPEIGFDNVSEISIGFDTKKGMNVDFGDFDNDGWLDMFVTNITTAEYLREGNMLWHKEGPGDFGVVSFVDIAAAAGTWDGGWGWGGKFLDADLDDGRGSSASTTTTTGTLTSISRTRVRPRASTGTTRPARTGWPWPSSGTPPWGPATRSGPAACRSASATAATATRGRATRACTSGWETKPRCGGWKCAGPTAACRRSRTPRWTDSTRCGRTRAAKPPGP